MKTSIENAENARLQKEVYRLQRLLLVRERRQEPLSPLHREEMQQQTRLFDTVLSSIVDFAYVFNRDGRLTYVNQALLNLWQRERTDALGKNFFELNYPLELAGRLQAQIESVFSTGQPLRDETDFTSFAENTRYYEYIFVPIFNTDGKVEAVAGTTRDITARQHEKVEREEHVRALEVERVRLVDWFMQAPALLAVLRSPQHVFERINLSYLQMVDQRPLLGKPVREALPEIEGQGFFEILDEVYRTGKPFVGKDIRIFFHVGQSTILT
jgi:PAS domain S-box-containing protein